MPYLQREKEARGPGVAALEAKITAWLEVRRAGNLAAPDPLTAQERETLSAYEYALGAPEIRDGDVSVPAGWGPMSAITPSADLSDAEAAKFARLLGCEVTTFGAPAPPAPRKPSKAEVDAARKARVAAHLAEEAARAADTKKP